MLAHHVFEVQEELNIVFPAMVCSLRISHAILTLLLQDSVLLFRDY